MIYFDTIFQLRVNSIHGLTTEIHLKGNQSGRVFKTLPAKKMIDNKPSTIYVKKQGKKPWQEKLDQEKAAIKKGNMKMIQRLIHQLDIPPTVDCWNDKKRRNLNRVGRKNELRKIAEENKTFAERLLMIANHPGKYYFDHIRQKMVSW
ncbi:sperm axonemal maintenance protein CFAP97D1-like [Narcine bancroftii]|uniref:sperm axonemal maintenance protein CFAP97D1-like n=1 Tax=Narcine bancroftii TaxID=1343680 RepID=UPI003831AF43